MVKYAESDIRDGLASLKIGVHNICYALKNKEGFTEIEIPFKLNMLILSGIIKEVFPDSDLTYNDSSVSIESPAEQTINIKIEDDRTIFYT